MPMPSLRHSIYASLIIITVFASCKKDSQSEPTPRLELLSAYKWQLTNLYHREDGDNQVSDFRSIHYSTCEYDDSYHFTADGQFFRRDSTNQCASPGHFGLWGSASWSADSSKTTLTFSSFPNYVYKMRLKTLTEQTLELDQDVVDYFQKKVTLTYRFRSF